MISFIPAKPIFGFGFVLGSYTVMLWELLLALHSGFTPDSVQGTTWDTKDRTWVSRGYKARALPTALSYHSSPKPMVFVPVLVTPLAMLRGYFRLCAQRITSGTEYLLQGCGHGNHMKANDSPHVPSLWTLSQIFL